MNYLSHFYFDRTHENPYHILGIALPDLVKNHHRRWNVQPHKNIDRLSDSPEFQSILTGWNRHLQVDKLFHEASYFIAESGKIAEKIRKLGLKDPSIKPFMLGHIGLELMLDTLLIQHNKISVNDFYSHLNACDPRIIEEFLKANNIEEPHTFKSFYERFCQVQYLLNYENNESVVYALNRIQYRLTGRYFSDSDAELLRSTFSEFISDIASHDFIIFNEIEKQLI
jgi:hypothetical protein